MSTITQRLKQKILDLAIRGKLVPQDPNDEPASELLKRIRAEKDELIRAKKIKKDKNPSEIVIGSDGRPYEKFADGRSVCIDDEIPFDLPNGWAWARLRDLGDFVGGHTPSLANKDNWESGSILWVTSKDMKQKYICDTGSKVSAKGAESLQMIPKGSLLMVTRSGILRRKFPVAIAAKDLTINQDQRALRFHLCGIEEYVYDVLKGLESIILRDYRKTGTTVESIIWEKFIDLIIPLPPLAEQKRIVAKIEELFAEVEKIATAKDGISRTAERINKKILDLAIRDQLVPQDPNDEPAEVLLKRIAEARRKTKTGRSRTSAKDESVIFRAADRSAYETRNGKAICIDDEIPFEIPDSWAWCRLRDLGDFVGGHTPSLADKSNWENGTILWVTSKDMKLKYIRDTGNKVSNKGAEELQLLPPGSLLMVTRSGILRRKFPIAIAAKPLTINQDQRALRFHVQGMEEYIYCVLKGLESIILRDYRKTGTTVESIIWEKFIDIFIPIPPLAEQKRIVAKIEEVRCMVELITRT